jgi:hypothetical protein
VKAIRFDRFGGSEVLEVRDIEMPEPKPGEVRILHRYQPPLGDVSSAVSLGRRLRHCGRDTCDRIADTPTLDPASNVKFEWNSIPSEDARGRN